MPNKKSVTDNTAAMVQLLDRIDSLSEEEKLEIHASAEAKVGQEQARLDMIRRLFGFEEQVAGETQEVSEQEQEQETAEPVPKRPARASKKNRRRKAKAITAKKTRRPGHPLDENFLAEIKAAIAKGTDKRPDLFDLLGNRVDAPEEHRTARFDMYLRRLSREGAVTFKGHGPSGYYVING